MREWLYNVMDELADRDEISKHYKDMREQAKVKKQKRKKCHTFVSREAYTVEAPLP